MRRICIQKFNPAQISNCVIFFDGTNPLFAKDNTRPANTTALSSLIDQSGTGNNGSQAVGANQPTYSTNSINGNASLATTATKYFSTTDTKMSSGSSARTFFSVSSSSSIATGQYIYSYGTNGVNQYFAPCFIASKMFIDLNARGATGSTTLLVNTPYIFCMNYNGGNISTILMYLNNVSQTVTPSIDATPNTVLSGTGYVSQFQGVTGFGLIGNIGEILLYSKSLSTSEQSLVTTYLKNKWRIS